MFVWAPKERNFSLHESRTDDITQVFDEDNIARNDPSRKKRLRELFSKWNIARP
jgi:hypothetical protein